MKKQIPVWQLVSALAMVVWQGGVFFLCIGGIACPTASGQPQSGNSPAASFSQQTFILESVPKENIQFLFEDSRELIWGYDHARKKLFVFDGADFTYIDPVQDGDLGCLENAAPYQVLEDQAGQIWIQYSCGVFIYDIKSNKMRGLNEELRAASQKPVLSIYNMTKGNEGKVHLATQTGVFEYSPSTKSFEYFDFGKNTTRKSFPIYVAFENSKGFFFYANSEELLMQGSTRDTIFQKLPYMIPLAGLPYGSFVALPNYAVFRSIGLVNDVPLNRGDSRFTKFDFHSKTFSLLQDDYPEFPPFIRVYNYGDLTLSVDSLGNLYEYNKEKDRFAQLLNVFDYIPKTYSINELKVFKNLKEDIIWVTTETSTYKIYPGPVASRIREFPQPSRDPDKPSTRSFGLVNHQGNVYFSTLPLFFPVRDFQAPPIEMNSPSLMWNNLSRGKFVESPGLGLFGILAYMEPQPGKIPPQKLSYVIWTRDYEGKESFKINEHSSNDPSSYRGGLDIMSAAPDRQGNVWVSGWVGTVSKLNFQDKVVTSSIETRDSIGRFSRGIRHVHVDKNGLLWVSYNSEGVDVFDSDGIKVQNLTYSKNNSYSLSSNYITALHEDKEGRMWVGTQRGLNCINPERTSVAHFFTQDGLLENTICGILSDKNDRIWVFTPTAVSCYSHEKNRFFSYKVDKTPLFLPYTYQAIDQEGFLFSGTPKGVLFFHPDSVQTLDRIPKLYIKNLHINNTDINHHIFSFSSELEKKPFKIELKHHQNSITINYGASEFYLPNEIQFAYLLEGYDREWQNVSNSRTATFTKIPPGSYKFILKCANSHDVWSEEFSPIHLTILPPWYWAWYSKSLYLLLLAGLLYAFYRFQLNRRLTQAEAQRLRELDSVKSRIYTNITHEFRTPLTVILGMADKIEEAPRQWLREGVKAIRRNGQGLLRLVNQMLDLARLEGGALPLTIIQGDINVHLKTLVELYRSYADTKNIAMQFTAEPEQLVMDYDPDKIADIVSNLLSNALKFTPERGKITVTVSKEQWAGGSRQWAGGSSLKPLPTAHRLLLTVQDTGSGIPPEKLPHIFDRFYQADDSATRQAEGIRLRETASVHGTRLRETASAHGARLRETASAHGTRLGETASAHGTGIGLALTKELVKLLGGNIEVQSPAPGSEGKGAAFIVSLPIRNTAPMQQAPPATYPVAVDVPAPQSQPADRSAGKLPLALIVEDNPDVTTLLVASLKNRYQIETASNGRQGIARAIEMVPDVIISDVMMPEMDGFELCRTLKDDVRTSHIPIVLLTARADMESRIEGLEMGADAYLAKPFNQRELEVSLRKSMELRRKLRLRYASGGVPAGPAPAIFNKNDEFVRRLDALMQANYSNPEFSAKNCEKGMAMSPGQLLRKMRSLFDTTPQRYLRSYRLKQAKHLLETTDMKILEIALEVGFSDHANFSHAFSREFGMPPGAWREG